MTDDSFEGGWQVDAATALALRLETARRAMWRRDFGAAVVELEEILDEHPDDLDALTRLAESTMELRSFAVAREAWSRLDQLGHGNPAATLQWAWCCFEVCQFDHAATLARRAVADAPYLAEAWFLLGLCADRADDPAAAQTHHAEAHRLSPLQHPFPVSLDETTWTEVITEAFQTLPPELQQFWDGTPVRLEQLPTLADLRDADPPLSPRVVALYEGTPPDPPDPSARPEAVRVFRRNLAYAESLDAMIDQLSWTLEQEALDWLGVEEE